MIAAFDVHYQPEGSASGAAVLFAGYSAKSPAAEITCRLPDAAEYVPGDFYRRELPCILKLYERIGAAPEEIVIDGYAMIGDRPGLGRHLFEALDGAIPVIGVAKTRFEDAPGIEILRGGSVRPLYITAAGIDPREAAERIRTMHGPHRIPTLLKRVDLLARGIAGNSFR
jgi:deoxyribonuclease V